MRDELKYELLPWLLSSYDSYAKKKKWLNGLPKDVLIKWHAGGIFCDLCVNVAVSSGNMLFGINRIISGSNKCLFELIN